MNYGNIDELSQCLMNTFILRRDIYAKQVENGSYSGKAEGILCWCKTGDYYCA